MITLGNFNTLRIAKRVDFGLYLSPCAATVSQPSSPPLPAEEILLPNRYVTPQMHIGDDIEVFIYLDQEERLVATTERPVAVVGQFAYLECSWINQYGAFLKWGIEMKDLFCPFREQKQRMERGRKYIVYIRIDEESYRLMATAKVERYLEPASPLASAAPASSPASSPASAPASASAFGVSSGTAAAPASTPSPSPLTHGTPVDCLIWQKSPLGFKCIVENRYQGMLYDNQIFRHLTTGDRMTAYIDHVRQDGRIDLTLQPTGHRQTLDFAEQLLRYIHENNGRCDLSDHSPAEIIYDRFKVSKKVFKRAVGDLYRRRLIILTDDGMHLA